jgi:SAM-dependent methyltransferase
MNDATQRFSDRVENYVLYRPDYPAALPGWLHDTCGWPTHALVADIGAGTGISARMFLDAGHTVVAVEPNASMRQAAQAWLGAKPGFRAVDGRAEATTLPDHSVQAVVVGQAFHWFDVDASRAEFRRILKPGGLAAIFWNTRRLTETPFLVGYERLLLDYGIDYLSVAGRYADDDTMEHYFGAGFIAKASFPHTQRLDFEQLRGRLLSSSYVPQAEHPRHAPMLAALRALFDATASDGAIDFDYDTRIFAGRMN